ncbi:DUF6065 family protein [Streptomyces puniciscabiei]
MNKQPDEGLPLVACAVDERTVAIEPAPACRAWICATRGSFANQCLPVLIAN